MSRFKEAAEDFFVLVGLLLIGALMGLVIVVMADPACGPTGEEQSECAEEILADLTGRTVEVDDGTR